MTKEKKNQMGELLKQYQDDIIVWWKTEEDDKKESSLPGISLWN